MRKFVVAFAAVAATTLAAAPAEAKKGHGAHKAQKHERSTHAGGRFDRRGGFGRDDGFGHRARGCPPGLAKKNNGCLPPGQAKKLGVGDRLPAYLSRYNVPEQYRDRYLDDRDYSYRYEDEQIYRVNRRSGLIDRIISVLGF